MNNMNCSDSEIIDLNQKMLDSVAQGRWDTYRQYCHDDMTCFEAETAGHLVEGLDFHRFYFVDPEAGGDETEERPALARVTVTMARPHVRWLGHDAAVISYTRLTQRSCDGEATTSTCCETRIWQRREKQWGLVHTHRS